MEKNVKKTYRHFKSESLYEVICFAVHSETGEELVVYRGLSTNRYWIRPKEMFFGTVQKDGKEVKRFDEVVNKQGDNPCGEIDLLPRC